MSDEARVLKVSMPRVRALLRSSPRDWSAAELAAEFGVLEKTIKAQLPRWVGAAANVRVLRSPRGHIKGFRYDVPPEGFEEQFGPTIDGLTARVAELEAEVASLKAR